MSEQATTEIRVPDDRPPDWANSFMKWVLTTPVLRAMVGHDVALLQFSGRRTGHRYEIPVSYQLDGDTVTIVTKRLRNWWHNFETPLEVELTLAGQRFVGKAEVVPENDAVLEFMADYLRERPIDAKAYGLKKEQITREHIARIVPQIVVIRIEVSPIG